MRLEGVQLGTVYPINEKLERQGSQKTQEKKLKNGEEIVGNVNPKEKTVPKDQLINAVEEANKSFEPFDRRFEISVHEKTNRLMINVINAENDELIREIPPEKLLDILGNMMEMAGIIVDEKI